jgi:hypothetical protein
MPQMIIPDPNTRATPTTPGSAPNWPPVIGDLPTVVQTQATEYAAIQPVTATAVGAQTNLDATIAIADSQPFVVEVSLQHISGVDGTDWKLRLSGTLATGKTIPTYGGATSAEKYSVAAFGQVAISGPSGDVRVVMSFRPLVNGKRFFSVTYLDATNFAGTNKWSGTSVGYVTDVGITSVGITDGSADISNGSTVTVNIGSYPRGGL